MQLIPNAAHALKMFSVQAFVSIAALQGVWAASPELQALLPAIWVHGITAALAVLGVIGRLVVQPKVGP